MATDFAAILGYKVWLKYSVIRIIMNYITCEAVRKKYRLRLVICRCKTKKFMAEGACRMRNIVAERKAKSTEGEQTETYISDIEKESLRLLEVVEATKTEMSDYYSKMLEDEHSDSETQGKLGSLKRTTANITKALSDSYAVSDELNARWNDIKKQKKKRKFISGAPANAAIDLEESETKHFAKGMNIYKLLLICYIGSFAGVVIELLWCLVKNGYIESRSGLVYGPFNLLYGAGAIALTVCLFKFRNRGSWISFAGGMIVGSVVEYLCSWGQEMLLGSRSWDYSDKPFNINGRICLLYSVFWGLLGVIWIKNIYPRMAKWILKIPNRAGKIITWVLTVFFVFNAFMSMVSVYRWSERTQGLEPSNSFEVFLDDRFPDERMERIFSNMDFSNSTD